MDLDKVAYRHFKNSFNSSSTYPMESNEIPNDSEEEYLERVRDWKYSRLYEIYKQFNNGNIDSDRVSFEIKVVEEIVKSMTKVDLN